MATLHARGRPGEAFLDAQDALPLYTLYNHAYLRFSRRMIGLKDFFQLPWFRRIWIVQEMALGKRVIMRMGNKQIDAYRFYNAILTTVGCLCFFEQFPLQYEYRPARTNESLEELGASPLQELVPTRNSTQLKLRSLRGAAELESKPVVGYLEFLYISDRKFACTDPRDRIYGLLAVKPTSGHLGIVPDYTIPVEQVYTQAARA